MSVEEVINDLIAKMYDCDDGWEFESDDEVGVRFVNIQNNLSHMTFNDWDEVADYVDKHLDE